MNSEIFKSLSNKGKQVGEKWCFTDFELYEVPLGGVSSSVYKATEKSSNVKCFIKKINITKGDEKENKKSSSEKAIQDEISFHRKLDSAYIIELYGYFIEAGAYYLILEDGGTDLCQIILEAKHILSPENIKQIFRQMLLAVDACHQKGIMHRDIKPDNFAYNNGMVKLLDFGAATENSISNQRLGSPFYAAPEVYNLNKINNCTYTNSVDIWSLGVTFYTLIVGNPPFIPYQLKYKLIGKVLEARKNDLILKFDLVTVDLIFRMLALSNRDSISKLLDHKYFKID